MSFAQRCAETVRGSCTAERFTAREKTRSKRNIAEAKKGESEPKANSKVPYACTCMQVHVWKYRCMHAWIKGITDEWIQKMYG